MNKKILMILFIFMAIIYDSASFSFSFADMPKEKLFLAMEQYNHQNSSYLSKGKEYSFVTFNTGLLRSLFMNAPYYEERRAYLINQLFQDQSDFILLQEVWMEKDCNEIKKQASEKGYFAYGGLNRSHGLMILIRRYAISHIVSFQESFFKDQVWYESIAGFKRALLKAVVTLDNNHTLTLINTHLAPLPIQQTVRDREINEILSITKIDKKNNKNSDYLFLGGDFNQSPETAWESYQQLIRKGHLIDATVASNSKNAELMTYDVEHNTIAAKMFEHHPSWAERLDYHFIQDKRGFPFYVKKSDLAFTEYIPRNLCQVNIIDRKYKCNISDHFGVKSLIVL